MEAIGTAALCVSHQRKHRMTRLAGDCGTTVLNSWDCSELVTAQLNGYIYFLFSLYVSMLSSFVSFGSGVAVSSLLADKAIKINGNGTMSEI